MKTLMIKIKHNDEKSTIKEIFSEEEHKALANENLLFLVVCGLLYKNSWIPDSVSFSYYWI